jgi:hypothetical protein
MSAYPSVILSPTPVILSGAKNLMRMKTAVG